MAGKRARSCSATADWKSSGRACEHAAARAGRFEVPAYAAMQNRERMGARMLEIVMRGVSTRNYKEVIPSMAETAGVSRSAVSRRVFEASEAEVQALPWMASWP